MNAINVKFKGNTIVMNFLNGTVTVPGGYGGYVVASGCGSGKTTIIKEIIRQKFMDGVLYAASTINEVDDMCQWIKSNLVGIPNDKGQILEEDDIVVLHSKEESSRFMYRLDPYEITRKKVVLCTHHKLLHDSPEILIKQRFDIRKYRRPITMIRNSVTIDLTEGTEYSMPRQYILIDEIPTCDHLKAFFQKATKISLMETVNNSIRHTDQNGNVVCDRVDMRIRGYKSREETLAAYDLKVKGTSIDPFPESANSDDPEFKSVPMELRKDLILDSFIENEGIHTDTNDFNSIKDGYVRYNISDFIIDEMQTRVIVFDGTGDLTFGNDNGKFNLRNIQHKYNSKCSFIKIDSNIARKFKESFINNHENEVYERLNKCCEQLKGIIEENEETLIVTWKDLKMESESKGKKKKSSIELNNTETEYNRNFSLSNYFTEKLKDMGVDENKFHVIYYQSGLDKATNEFKDYDSIVFLGEFHVPNNVIEEFNRSYSANSNQFKFTLYQLVQAICRTRIRNHKGESVNIYMTDDWDNKYVMALNLYLNYNRYDGVESLTYCKPYRISIEGCPDIIDARIVNPLDKIAKKWRPVIEKLNETLFPGLLDDIENEIPREISTTLDEIHSIIPLKVKEVRKYYPLINCLRKSGIELTITSR